VFSWHLYRLPQIFWGVNPRKTLNYLCSLIDPRRDSDPLVRVYCDSNRVPQERDLANPKGEPGVEKGDKGAWVAHFIPASCSSGFSSPKLITFGYNLTTDKKLTTCRFFPGKRNYNPF
jgi:hypothetical protein